MNKYVYTFFKSAMRHRRYVGVCMSARAVARGALLPSAKSFASKRKIFPLKITLPLHCPKFFDFEHLQKMLNLHNYSRWIRYFFLFMNQKVRIERKSSVLRYLFCMCKLKMILITLQFACI